MILLKKFKERHIDVVRRYRGAQIGMVQIKTNPSHNDPKK